MIGCQQAGWTFGELITVGRLDDGEKQTGARYATLYNMNNHTPGGFSTGIT
jgi:predicted PolB exonuclease-like 3'-5' exonuclease